MIDRPVLTSLVIVIALLSSCTRSLPEGAVRLGPELVMVPRGTDEDGCRLYQPTSRTMSVIQALHYRTADGGFTLDRSEAACAREPRDARPAG